METSGYRLLLSEGTLDYFVISDVKESSTEIVIYLEEKNEVPGEYSSMQVESTKHRNGAVGEVLLRFKGEFTRF